MIFSKCSQVRVERSFFSNFQNFIIYQSLPRSLNENRSRPFHKPYLFDSIKLLSLRLANILENKTEIFRKKNLQRLNDSAKATDWVHG